MLESNFELNKSLMVAAPRAKELKINLQKLDRSINL